MQSAGGLKFLQWDGVVPYNDGALGKDGDGV